MAPNLKFGSVDINNTHFLTMLPITTFNETVAQLHTIGLSNNINIFEKGDNYKNTFHIEGSFNGEVFTLYDYKCDNEIHIGGHDTLDIDNFITELIKLLEKTNPTNFTSKYYYDLCEGDATEYSYPV